MGRGLPGRDRDQLYRALRADAVAAWGETRATAIEATLRRTADAVWKLAQLEFRGDERPGFFLLDLARLAGAEGPADVARPPAGGAGS